MNERKSEFGLVLLSLLPAAVMGGGTANGSAERKTSQHKQTKHQTKRVKLISWNESKEENGIKLVWWNGLLLRNGKKFTERHTKRKHFRAASPFISSLFCWPALRHQKQRKRWNGREIALLLHQLIKRFLNQLLVPLGEEKKSINPFTKHSLKRMLEWLIDFSSIIYECNSIAQLILIS